MKKSIFDFTTPSGTKGNLTSIGDITSMIIGVMIFLLTFGIGQKLFNKVEAVIPYDQKISPLYSVPKANGMAKRYV